ncbi:response regulator transcription factor [Fusibacter sp. JL298sf-3]
MNNSKILVVDDDIAIANAIKRLLQKEGHVVFTAHNGLDALKIVESRHMHLMILDIMMPTLDGLSTLMKLREKQNIPVILLSAKSEESDKVLGLSIGADDYVTKPYNPQELAARVKSHLRRYTDLGDVTKTARQDALTVGGLSLNTGEKQLYVDGDAVHLTQTEYNIMHLLMSHPNIVFSAERIYDSVWGMAAHGVENTVMVHIRRIREKIEINPKEPKYLKVVWGIGYKIEKL